MKIIRLNLSMYTKIKRILFFVYFLVIGSSSFAQTTEVLFKAANDFYKKGAYENALKSYQQIEAKQLESADLYYNLGNTYYKLNQVAPAIYYFEKALKLDPTNKDFKNNLSIAQRTTIDKIDSIPKTFLQKIDESYIRKFSFETWAYVSIVASILFVLLFLSYYFAFHSTLKRLYFILSILSFLFIILSFTFAYTGADYEKNHQPAIIFSQLARVKNAPTLNSTDVFELHEGTKVIILEQVDDWLKIKLADGKIGWIAKTDLKAL